MEFIIKPTSACDFRCDFCAASDFHCDTLESIPKSLEEAIYLLEPSNIIFTGGEPTMASPDFYQALLDEYPNMMIDITTNLHHMMDNLNDWADIITNKNFKVTTSFNFGKARKMSDGKPYYRELFCMDMFEFENVAGYMPCFIAVLSPEDDYGTVKKYCELAKSLKTLCRVNGANPIGRQSIGVPRWRMLEYYMKLIDEKLGRYEINCIERSSGKCPMNTSLMCKDHIRAMYFKNGTMYWSNCEENLNMGIDIHKGLDWINCILPVEGPYKAECLMCDMYRICNGCKVNAKNLTEDDCANMKRIAKKVIEYGWKY